jgi:hypothetical protein
MKRREFITLLRGAAAARSAGAAANRMSRVGGCNHASLIVRRANKKD